MAGQLNRLFGGEQVGEKVKKFNFAEVSGRLFLEDYLHLDLAPAYGSLNGDTIRQMDNNRKVMISGVVRSLGQIPNTELKWDKVNSLLMQSPMMELDPSKFVYREDKLVKSSFSDFKTDGNPDAAIVQEVKNWFDRLISDRDVLESTKIDGDVLAKIVSQTGVILEWLAPYKQDEAREKSMIDIAVLRFPDQSNEHFKLFRIQLNIRDDCTITGEFQLKAYGPRHDVLQALSESSRGRATGMADELFN